MSGIIGNVRFVTGNPEKAEHFARHIGLDISHAPADLEEIQSLNSLEIIEHKARQAYQQIQKPVLVEDVEFAFHALGGLPGPFIKFFVQAEDGAENLCRILDGFSDRGATASCTYAYFDGQKLTTFVGKIDGVVAEHPRGTQGYGYDIVFEPIGFDGKTAGELSRSEYDQYYTVIKPFADVRAFLLGLDKNSQ